jgi:DNA-binding transcriptional regulator YiaG
MNRRRRAKRTPGYYFPRLEAIRAIMGLDVPEFSRLLGIAPDTWYLWKRHRNPSRSVLILAELLRRNPSIRGLIETASDTAE